MALRPLSDQKPAPLVLVQVEHLDSHTASALSRSGASTEPRYSPLLRMMMTLFFAAGRKMVVYIRRQIIHPPDLWG
jgi:hypothetical protein